MKLIIDQQIFDKYPNTNIGVIVAKNLDNHGETNEIAEQLRQIENKIKESYQTETLSQQPKINCWRKAYSAFGVKGGDYRSSVEALYRRVIKGGDLRHINNLVDIYNLISLKHMLPVGGEDIDHIEGDIHLSIATNSEPAVQLLGDQQPEPPKEGEVIYKDDISAICRRWNWREADRTKLTEATKSAILVIEGVGPTTQDEVVQATSELAQLVKKHCGGNTTVKILNNNTTELAIT